MNYNRYGYALNNPLIYTDPDGEFWHLIIGAAIGGTFNWLANGAEFSWEGLGYFGIGAAAGAVGAGVGSGISASLGGSSFGAGFIGTSSKVSTGFVSGVVSGAGGGFAGGFSLGAGNSLYKGDSFNEGLSNGLEKGLDAAVSGAILGGIMGGMDATEHNRDFWSGARKDDVIITVDNGNIAFESVENYSNTTQESTLKSYRTRLGNNSSVVVNGENIRVEIPQKGVMVDQVIGPEGTSVFNYNAGKGFVSFTTVDEIDWITMGGWKYSGNSNKSVFNLKYWFRWRKR